MKIKKVELLSLVVAVVAVALSQFKPLYEYFTSPEFEIEINQNLQMTHLYGKIFLHPHFSISNTGDAPGKLNDVKFFVLSKGSDTFKEVLTAKAYFANAESIGIDSQPTPHPFSNVTIMPDIDWAHYLGVDRKRPNVEDELEIAEIHRRYVEEFESVDLYENRSTQVSDALFQRTESYSNENLKHFSEGTYYLLMSIWTEGEDNATHNYLYEFNIRKQDVTLFEYLVSRYKYGEGIVKPFLGQYHATVELKKIEEKPILKNVLDKFDAEYKKCRPTC